MTILNQSIIEGANNNSFFNRGTHLEEEAQAESNRFKDITEIKRTIEKWSPLNDEQENILTERESSWKALVAEQYNSHGQFLANNVPWFIAGPANYPAAKFNRHAEADRHKQESFEEKKERFIKNTCDMLDKAALPDMQILLWRHGRQGYGATIQANDPLAVEKMKAHIEYLEDAHKKHLFIIKVARKMGNVNSIPWLSDQSKDKINAELKSIKERGWGTLYFTDNEAQDIRNKKIRLKKLEKERELAESHEAENFPDFPQGKAVNNHEAARVQIFFNDIPDEETRSIIKSYGFKWSPKNKAWQRQNTLNGLSATRQLINKLNQQEIQNGQA